MPSPDPAAQPYLSLEAEFHDAFWAADDDGSEIRLMGAFLRKHRGLALEIGAGSGRLMFPLLRQGFPVEGLELSPDMLRLARASPAGINPPPILHEGDMSSWAPAGEKRYSSILAPAFTLQLAADPAATLRHWRKLLAENGALYLTIFIPYAELEGDQPEGQWYPDHRAVLPDGRTAVLESRHHLDPEKQILEREHRYYFADEPDGSHISRQRLRWFTHDQMVRLLEECGFRVTAAFPDFNPRRKVISPETMEYDGILTYHAELDSAHDERFR